MTGPERDLSRASTSQRSLYPTACSRPRTELLRSRVLTLRSLHDGCHAALTDAPTRQRCPDHRKTARIATDGTHWAQQACRLGKFASFQRQADCTAACRTVCMLKSETQPNTHRTPPPMFREGRGRGACLQRRGCVRIRESSSWVRRTLAIPESDCRIRAAFAGGGLLSSPNTERERRPPESWRPFGPGGGRCLCIAGVQQAVAGALLSAMSAPSSQRAARADGVITPTDLGAARDGPASLARPARAALAVAWCLFAGRVPI